VGRVASKTLTVKQVESEKRDGYYADGACPGLNLQVVQGQGRITRSWLFRYTSPTTKKRREFGLGSTRVRSLADARRLATDLRLQVLNGYDPKDERDRQRAAAVAERAHRITFDEAVSKCLESKSLEWKNVKHGQQWINTLATYASPLQVELFHPQLTSADVLAFHASFFQDAAFLMSPYQGADRVFSVSFFRRCKIDNCTISNRGFNMLLPLLHKFGSLIQLILSAVSCFGFVLDRVG